MSSLCRKRLQIQGLSKSWLRHYAISLDFLQRLVSYQNKNPIELILQYFHQLSQSFVPKDQTICHWPSYKHVIGSQRKALKDIVASPHSSVNKDGNFISDCSLYEWQDVDRRGYTVQLSSSVVGNPYCITVVQCNLCIFGVHDTLEDYLQVCQASDSLDGLPVHRDVPVGEQLTSISGLVCIADVTDFLKYWEDGLRSIKCVLKCPSSGSQHLSINCYCQPCEPILLCQSNLAYCKCPIIGDVHLHESHPTAILCCYFRVRLCGERAQSEDHVVLSCYFCRDELSIRMRKCVHCPGCKSKGKGQWSVEDGCGEVGFGGTDQYSGDDHELVEAGFVFFEGFLVLTT